MEVPRQLPDGPFDLLVLSEVAYYWSIGDLELMAAFAGRAVERRRRHRAGALDRRDRLSPDRRRGGAALHRRHGAVHADRACRIGAELYRIDVLRRLGQRAPPA